MRCTFCLLFILGTHLLAPPSSHAKLWRVEKDGSGNFTVIQDAVDASAPGDSVLIGPGRYTDTFPFATPVITVITHVGVSQGPLTILGVDSSQVIVGPVVPNLVGFGPKGISIGLNAPGVVIENLTVENVHDGIFAGNSTTVRNCSIRDNQLGVFADGAGVLLSVSSSTFTGNESIGIFTSGVVTGADIVDSSFNGNEFGVDLSQTTNGSVRNCTFSAGRVAIQFDQFSVGEIIGCTITGTASCSIGGSLGGPVHPVQQSRLWR